MKNKSDETHKNNTGAQDKVKRRERTEDALRESEEKYFTLVENATDGVAIIQDTVFKFANKRLAEMYGYTVEELTGKSIYDIAPADFVSVIKERVALREQGKDIPEVFCGKVLCKDGTIKETESSTNLIQYEGRPASMMIARDITERKNAEQNFLLISKAVESSSDAIAISNLCDHHFYLNKAFIDLFEYTTEELYALGGGSAAYTDKKIAREVFDTIKSGESWSGEVEMISRSGRKFPVTLHADAIKDDDGKIIGLIGVHTDITERKNAEAKLQETINSLKKSVGTTIQVLATALEARDPYTAGHESRSANLACAIAVEMGLSQEKIEGIRMAGSIHDIGKLSIPAEILSKPTKLTKLEFALIKEHSQSGFAMLKDVESPWPLAEIVHQHHERMNGSGYPRNLKGDEIILEARILAVADVVEAMASHRPYRAALGIEVALEEIKKNKGILYDDAVADACLKLFREKGYQLK